MKKALSLVLCALLVLALFAGCGGGGSSSSAPPASSSAAPASSSTAPREPQTLIFWHSMTDAAGEQVENAVKAFNDGPGKELQITVEAVFQGQYADATTKLHTILQSDQVAELPNVMQIDATGVVDYMSTDYAYTVDDALAVDTSYDISQILASPLKAWNYGGSQLGMPFSASTTVMYYNATLLEAAGVTEAPTTFDEIIEVAGKLPATNSAGQSLAAYAQIPNTPTLANWIGQMSGAEYDASYVVDNRNGREGQATKLVCDTEGTLLTFLKGWKAMYDAGALLNQGESLGDMFLAEQLVFYTTSTSNTTSLLAQIDGRFELGCAPFPRVSKDSNYGATISGSALFMFNKNDDAQAAAAWDFVKYMIGADVQANFAAATGYYPVNQGSYAEAVYTDYVTQYPQVEVGKNQIDQTSPDMMGVTVGPSRDFYLEIQNQVSTMLTTGASPEDTVPVMADALNALLDQYNEANPA